MILEEVGQVDEDGEDEDGQGHPDGGGAGEVVGRPGRSQLSTDLQPCGPCATMELGHRWWCRIIGGVRIRVVAHI